jgi:ATP-dependent RNA helicase SUPV3L1/SUV3
VKTVETPLSGLARGVAFQLLERFGVLSRGQVAGELRQIDQDARKGLRRFQIRIGATALYIPQILKPHAVELRLLAWALWHDIADLPVMPTPGLVWIQTDPKAPREFYEIAGFRLIGGHEAVRLDMLERLADMVRPLGLGGQKFTVTPEIMGLVGCSGDSFVRAMRAVGYGHEIVETPAPVSTPDSAVNSETDPTAQADADIPAEAAPQAEAGPQTDAGLESTATLSTEPPAMIAETRFFWAPRPPRAATRPHHKTQGDQAKNPTQKHGRKAAQSPDDAPANRTGPDAKPRHEGQKGRRPQPDRGGADQRRPNRGGTDRSGPDHGKQGPRVFRSGPQGQSAKSGASGRSDGKAAGRSEINEDSPFAQLKALKAALEKRSG